MHWIASSEKGTEQAVPAPHFAELDCYSSARPEGLLGLSFLRFAEVLFSAQRAGSNQSPLNA